MNTYRKNAIAAGLFLILGMITGFAVKLSVSVFNDPDYLIMIP